jgi:hypothetical protein
MIWAPNGEVALTKSLTTTIGYISQGAAAASIPLALTGNPSIMWTMMTLFQAYYYLLVINVNYPYNVQNFFKLFAMGQFTFL